MLRFFPILCICLGMALGKNSRGQDSGEPHWRGPWKGLPELIALLGSVPEGKLVLERAAAKDPGFRNRIKAGDASFTESTFSRTYSLWSGQEKIELFHEITLNRRLNLGEAVVDLAHELVHFSAKEVLDPYRLGFALPDFVRKGVEGPGGELDALAEECRVAWALAHKYRSYPVHRLCAPFRAAKGGFDREKARLAYYSLGEWWKRAPEALRKAIPELSDQPVLFTSSYARKPYPIALGEEFASTRKLACANNRKKYRLIASQAAGRGPASDPLRKEKLRLKAYERLNCQEAGE